MSSDMIKSKQIWVPERAFGICLWIKEDGFPVVDSDGAILCAEGLVGDEAIEIKVAEAGRYWTGSEHGVVRWVPGARKISSDERDDQAERLANGLIADPYEDFLDNFFGR